MLKIFFAVTFVISFQLLRTDCFTFSVTRDLSSTEVLEKANWIYVDVVENENDTVTVKVDIPTDLNFSEIFVFFANDAKEILRLMLNNTIIGTFYNTPYNKTKEMISKNVTQFESNLFFQVYGEFPRQWLPENSSKISATVVGFERYFNYYGIQNFDISFPDLMVVEEFKNYT